MCGKRALGRLQYSMSVKRVAKKVLIISYHFYPGAAIGAKRPSELAAALQASGVEVVVVAAKSQRYLKIDNALVDRIPNIEVCYVPVPLKVVDTLWAALKRRESPDSCETSNPNPVAATYSNPETILAKLKRYFLALQTVFDGNKMWCLLACIRVLTLRLGKSVDLIISSGPPMSAHIVALLAKRIFGAKWIIDLRDPWMNPERLVPNASSKLTSMMENTAEERGLRACDLVICAAPGIRRQVIRHYEWAAGKTVVVYNGFDDTVSQGSNRVGRQLALLYLGNLYKNRDPFPLLEALAGVLARPGIERDRVIFRLVGNCREWGGVNVEKWLTERGIADRVRTIPRVGIKQIPEFMSTSNVLVNFAQGQPDQIPAKTFEYLASGKEVLCVTEKDSDTGILVRESGVGRVVDPTDHAGMSQALLELYDYYVVRGGKYVAKPRSCERYSRNTQNARYLELIAQLL